MCIFPRICQTLSLTHAKIYSCAVNWTWTVDTDTSAVSWSVVNLSPTGGGRASGLHRAQDAALDGLPHDATVERRPVGKLLPKSSIHPRQHLQEEELISQ